MCVCECVCTCRDPCLLCCRMSVIMLDPEEMHVEPDHSMRADPSIKGKRDRRNKTTLQHVLTNLHRVVCFCIPVVKVPYRIMDKSHIAAILSEERDALLGALARNFFTLYELWEWFVDHTGNDCSIEVIDIISSWAAAICLFLRILMIFLQSCVIFFVLAAASSRAGFYPLVQA